MESNHRHRDFQSLALPTELQSQKKWRSRRGLNPRSSAWQADVLATAPRDHWLREEDLNLWPLGYEPNELPNCSIPRYKSNWRRKRDSNPCAACTTFRFSRPVPSTRLGYSSIWWCLRPDLNRHEGWFSQDFKSCASTNSATQARWWPVGDSNSRPFD